MGPAGQQGAGVGVTGLPDQFARRPLFDDAPRIHDGNAVSHLDSGLTFHAGRTDLGLLLPDWLQEA